MKRLFLLFAVSCACFASCSETLDAEDTKDPTEQGGDDNKEYTVSFKVDMLVPELEDEVIKLEDEISRAYVKFYTDLITSRLAVPNDYTLTFEKDGEIVGEYKGTWGETEIALSNGTYRVTGQCDGDFNTASFSFDEEITIDKNTSILTLKPRFNCWLCLLDRRVFSNAWRCNVEKNDELIYLKKTDDFFYIFVSSSLSKIPFVLRDSANCHDLHEQIEYTDGNTWHLGIIHENANYMRVDYLFMRIGKVSIYAFDDIRHSLVRDLPKP